MTLDIRTAVFALVAFAALAAPYAVKAQTAHDEQQQLMGQLQTEKREVMMKTLGLDDAQVLAFTPIYDRYQVEHKRLFDRASDLLELYADNYEAITDDAAKDILRDWFSLQDAEVALTRKYVKQLERVLPPAKVVRFVQIESKIDTLLKLRAVGAIPLAM